MTEVQQTLMNYCTNIDRANNTNIHPDHPDHNSWPRNNTGQPENKTPQHKSHRK